MDARWTSPENAARPEGSKRVWPSHPPCRPPEKIDRLAQCIGKTIKSVEFVDLPLAGFAVEGTREAIALHFDDGTSMSLWIGSCDNHVAHDGKVSLSLSPRWEDE